MAADGNVRSFLRRLQQMRDDVPDGLKASEAPGYLRVAQGYLLFVECIAPSHIGADSRTAVESTIGFLNGRLR